MADIYRICRHNVNLGRIFVFDRKGEEEKAKQARQAVIWAVVGIAVGIIAFSLPLIIRNSLGVG